MNENLTTIIITAISVIFGAGGWKFYEFLIRNKREQVKEEKRDDLISRVEKLENDKDNCTESLMDMKVSVASLTVKVEFLEKENELLKIRLSN